MKQLIKNIVESARRLKMKTNMFQFRYDGELIRFYLPYKRDYIQQQILFRKTFYEEKVFEKINEFIKKDFTFLDIGSNIGNHIIYFSKIWKAKKVYGFEPQGNQSADFAAKGLRDLIFTYGPIEER